MMFKEDFLKNYTELISSGSTPKGGNKVYLKKGEILFFRGQNILMNRFSDHDSVYIPNEIHNQMKRTWVKKGDVLLVITGSIGRTAVYECEDYKANVNQHVCIIRLKNFNVLDPYYLSYFLASPPMQRHIMRISIGATRPALNFSQIGKFKIPIPPIKIQKKIAEILEKVEKLRKWRVETDELSEKYLESLFINFFGNVIGNPKKWEEKSVEELCSEIVDCPHSTPKYVDYKTEFPCIRTTELKNGYIDWKEMKYLDEDGYSKRIKRLKPSTGDIVYGREGSFGEAARVPRDTNICLGQRVMLFRPNESCNSTFLWALLRSEGIYSQAVRKTSGSTVGHVNIKDIKRFKAFCPPLELQNQFANIVTQFEEIKNYQSQSKQQIDNLFNTLMQKAFKGELVC